MFKLPVCPYCNTIYRYNDVRKISKQKQYECYHCKKSFKISKIFLVVYFFIVAVFEVLLNVIQLNVSSAINFYVLVFTNIFFIFISMLFVPFFIAFKKNKNNKNNKK